MYINILLSFLTLKYIEIKISDFPSSSTKHLNCVTFFFLPPFHFQGSKNLHVDIPIMELLFMGEEGGGGGSQ